VGNPFTDYLSNYVTGVQARYDAQYANDLKVFQEGCASYQERAQRQYDIDGTVIASPSVPVKKTISVVNGAPVEGSWVDPNIHAPVFTPAVVVKPTGMPDITGAVSLDQVASMLVLVAKKLDELLARGK
jgi:hypothetical protein